MFGGSFDPPHLGHLEVIKASLEQLDLQRLFIVPNFLNPFKQNTLFAPNLRLKWLKLLLDSENLGQKAEVLDYEIQQGKPTPTLKTIQYLNALYPKSQIYLILGSDLLPNLQKWHNFIELQKKVEFVIFKRENYEITKEFSHCLQLKVPFCAISSTQIRQKQPKALEQIPKAIKDDVLKNL